MGQLFVALATGLIVTSIWLLVRNARTLTEKIITKLLVVLHPIKDAQNTGIPGPNWKPFDGQTLEKFLDGKARTEEWQRCYGPIYRIWSGTTPEIVITRPEDIRSFHSDSAAHNKARSSNAGWMFHQLLGECMGLINGPRWTALRNEFGPTYAHSAVVEKASILSVEAREYVDHLDPQRRPGFRLRAADAVSRFPFFCTATSIYGPLSSQEKDQLWSVAQQNLAIMGKYVLLGGIYRSGRLSRWLSPASVRELGAFQAAWEEFNVRMFRTRREKRKLVPIVELWRHVEEGLVTKDEALHTLSEILFANLDVATGTLSWLVIFLALDESVQKQLREELGGRPAEESCTKKDDLLAYCFMETLRLRPFTAFSIPESSPNDKILGGFQIPANTSVVVSALHVNYNKGFWGQDSDQFRPGRFSAVKALDLRYNLFSFGFGTRKCLGQRFGEVMLKLFVIHLLGRYDISLTPAARADLDKVGRDNWVPIPEADVFFTERKA
ncbi:cytochrome P450 [Chaetomidium leptoderma]|uniref:Cytochrome P450 n=1 Tax=Chaetomidium leptoderma TaxID=669021 RepID=A0AAN6VLM3_9PEZI|nr:cytochrome P450 [Chaetomidium leptoderma]